MHGALKSLLLASGIILSLAGPHNSLFGQDESKEKQVVTLDGLHSRTPADWIEEKPSSRFRIKQFRLPAIGDDKDNAEMVIFSFGPGGGGSPRDNINRWKGLFVPPEGKKIDEVAKVEESKVSDVAVTYLDIHGTYLFKDRPFDPKSTTSRRPNYRMFGVIFESKNGPYFMRLVGPAETVAHYKKGFDDWLKSFK